MKAWTWALGNLKQWSTATHGFGHCSHIIDHVLIIINQTFGNTFPTKNIFCKAFELHAWKWNSMHENEISCMKYPGMKLKIVPQNFYGWEFHAWNRVQPNYPWQFPGQRNHPRGKIFVFMHGNFAFSCRKMKISCMKSSFLDFFHSWIFCCTGSYRCMNAVTPLKARKSSLSRQTPRTSHFRTTAYFVHVFLKASILTQI